MKNVEVAEAQWVTVPHGCESWKTAASGFRIAAPATVTPSPGFGGDRRSDTRQIAPSRRDRLAERFERRPLGAHAPLRFDEPGGDHHDGGEQVATREPRAVRVGRVSDEVAEQPRSRCAHELG